MRTLLRIDPICVFVCLVALAGIGSKPAWALPIEVSNVFHYRESFTANPYAPAGAYIGVGAYVTPNPYTNDVNIAQGGPGDAGDYTTVTASQNGVTLSIPHIYTTIPNLANQYGIYRPYDPSLTGPWTLTIENPYTDNQQVVVQTNSIENVDSLPFVKNITVSGSGTDLTVSWTQPDSNRVSGYAIAIFDMNQGKLVHIDGFDPGQTSYQIPQQFTTGDTFTLGTNYLISIRAAEFVDIGGASTFIASSQSYFNLTAVQGALDAYLPTVDPNGYYNFNVDITNANEIMFFDPLVAVGYDYLIGDGNPNFSGLQLPDIGDGKFALWLFDEFGNAFDSGFELLADTFYDFLPYTNGLGLSQFRILGIETSAGLDPGDVTAFVTGLSFVAPGQFTGQMRPIVENVPEPATLALFVLGVVGIGLNRLSARRRSCAGVNVESRC